MRKLSLPRPHGRILLVSCLLAAFCSTLAPSPGHSDTGHKHHTHRQPMRSIPEVGLEERIGAVIPLETTFLDEQGRPVELSELITVPTLIAPVYFSCPNVCSFLQGSLAQVLPDVRLTPDKDYRVLSISFDELESPTDARKARQTYRTAMNAPYPEDAWRFLTGDEASIRHLLDAAGYRFTRRGEDFLHPVAVFVVNPDGRIVRYLHGTRMLPLDVTLALTEAAQGRLGATIRKVVQFCFSYDPGGRRYVFNLLRVSAVAVILMAGGFAFYLILSSRKKPGE
ncbi:SCO family protein [Syntrophotalea carbinolica]|nr:SCO family protein [Syntrophotalea carbinolica]